MNKIALIALMVLLISNTSTRAQNTESNNIFFFNGIYYSPLADSPGEIAVVCGNKSFISPSQDIGRQRDIMYYPWMDWVGNSYTEEVVIPQNVIIPELGNQSYTVTKIDEAAFINCSSLTSVSIPSTINEIGGGAFENCTSISEIILPDGVRHIGDRAFTSCSALNHLHYSLGCTYIGELSICLLSQVEKVCIDGLDNVKYVYNSGLSSLKLPDLPYMPSLEWVFQGGISDTNITKLDLSYISDGTGIFQDASFISNQKLESITLTQLAPDNINEAFSNCPAINYIKIFNAEPPALSHDWAAQIDPECVLDVPDGSLELYRNATYWKNFPIIKEHSAGIDTPATQIPFIEAGSGYLKISSQSQVSVFDSNGRLQAAGTSLNLSLPCGVYLISDGHISKKALVK